MATAGEAAPSEERSTSSGIAVGTPIPDTPTRPRTRKVWPSPSRVASETSTTGIRTEAIARAAAASKLPSLLEEDPSTDLAVDGASYNGNSIQTGRGSLMGGDGLVTGEAETHQAANEEANCDEHAQGGEYGLQIHVTGTCMLMLGYSTWTTERGCDGNRDRGGRGGCEGSCGTVGHDGRRCCDDEREIRRGKGEHDGTCSCHEQRDGGGGKGECARYGDLGGHGVVVRSSWDAEHSVGRRDKSQDIAATSDKSGGGRDSRG